MDIKTIQVLLNTLGRITVSGKENLSMLLACINMLETALKDGVEKLAARKEEEK